MDGNGEGMVAVVHGLCDAGLAVTLMSRRYANQGRKAARALAVKNQCLPQTKSSIETNTPISYDRIRSHAGAQICDDRYASSYQMAHCMVHPSSPPISLSEFPPQRTEPNRTRGNFEIGGIGSGGMTSGPIRTQYSFRSSLRWANRQSVQFSRASCQTDPFVHSLRRYPSFAPSRCISDDLIDRLIKHTQAKNFTKPSKISKSMRSLSKDKTDENKNRQENKQSKNIQTYTRTKIENQSNNNVKDGYVRKERSYRISFSGDRRHKKNINTTYDYLKGNSSLYRKRQDRSTEVRYLDNLTKYLKDTLQQIYDDDPVMCPIIQSRYDQHRRSFHPEPSNVTSNETDDQAAPSGSRAIPSTSAQPGTCKKNCPKGRKFCNQCSKPLPCHCVKAQTEATTSSPSARTASKCCQCLPENTEPEKKRSKDIEDMCLCEPYSDESEGYDQKKSYLYKQKVNDEVPAWIDELPVKAGDTPENVAERQRIGSKLADALKKIPQDDNFDDNVMNEVKTYLDILPIWLPVNKAAKDAFKDLMARNLLDRLKKISDKPDVFADTIKKWVNDIDFTKCVNKNKIADNFIGKLKPIALNRPENDYEYAQKLRGVIGDMLEEMPIKTKGDKEKAMNELATKLIDKLVSLPKDAVKPEYMVKSLNEIVKIINDWLDEEDEFKDFPFLKYSKAVQELAEKLRELQANGVDEGVMEEMKKIVQDFLKNVLDIGDQDALEKLANKLLKKLLGDILIIPTPKNREEEIEKLYEEIYNWMKNQPEISHLDREKIKELSRELANEIYDNKISGGDEINKSEWLKRKLSDAQENRRKRKLVLKEIDIFLADAVTEIPSDMKEELKDKLADMLIGNVDEIINYTVDEALLEDETDRLIDNLFEGVKNIYAPDKPTAKVKIPKITKQTLQKSVVDLLNNTVTDINNKGEFKTNLMNMLADGIRKKIDENELIKYVYDQLRAANVPDDVAKYIAQKLLNDAKDMALTKPSKFIYTADYQQKDNIFVPDEILKLDKRRRSSVPAVDAAKRLHVPEDTNVRRERRSTMKDGINLDGRRKSTKQNDEPLSEELVEKQSNGPLDKVMASLRRYSTLPKVPRRESKPSSAAGYKPSPTSSYSTADKKELIQSPIRLQNPSLSSGEEKSKTRVKNEQDAGMSQFSPDKATNLKSRPLDSKKNQKIKQNKYETKIDNREDLAKSLQNIILDQVETGDIEDVRDVVNKILHNANITPEQAKEITNKLLGMGKDLSKVVAQKTKAGSSKSRPIDSKTKQEIKKSLQDDTQKALDKVKTKIDNREDLEANILNTILHQIETGDIEDVRDDVNKLLRDANVSQKQAEDITNNLLGKGKDIAKVVAQKTKARPLISKSLDSKTKQEIKQVLKTDIEKALDKVRTTIDNKEDLVANLLNTILNQVETGDMEDVRDVVNKLLHNANIPQEQAKDITNKLLGIGKDLSEVVAQKTKTAPSKSRPVDSKTKKEFKQSLRADTQKALDEVKTKIDNREDLEANLVNTILNQVEMGDVEVARHDVNKLLRNANIPQEQAKDITNKLLGKGKDLSEVVAQKTKTAPSKSRPVDSKTKQETKQSLRADTQKALDKVKTKISNREDLEANLVNTILNQVEMGDVEDARHDVNKLLRNANIPQEQAKDITNKLLGKGKDLAEVVAQKTKARPSISRPVDSKTKKEFKQSLRADTQKALDEVKTKIDNREDLEANLVNTILNQVEMGDVEVARHDVNKLLRNANIPQEQAKDITNKLLGKGKDLAEVVAQKTKARPSISRPVDSKTKKEFKQSLRADTQKALDEVKTKIDNREDLEANLVNTVLNQVEMGDVEDARYDVNKLLRNANIPQEQAKDITNKLLGKGKDLAEVVAQKTKARPSISRPVDSKTKQETKQSLRADTQKALDKVKTKIDNRDDLEANLVNTILNQVEMGDVEVARHDVNKLLRNANIPQEQAKDITNRLLGKGKDLAEVVAQKTKARPSISRPVDSKTKQETKQSLRADTQKTLDKVKTKIDNREDLEANLVNTVLNQVEMGDVEDARYDVNKLLRNANIPQEQAKDITNKLLGKGKDLAEVVAQKTKARPWISKSLDSKTKQETKQILKTDIQKVLDKVKTKIDNRDDLEANLVNNILNQVEMGDVEDARHDVNKLLRNANIPQEQAKDITNKLLGKGKDLAEVVAQKTKGRPSISKSLDSKTKQETKQILKTDIQKVLDKVKTKIDNREDLEANLLNNIFHQVETGDIEDVRDNVNMLLRDANLSQEQAKDITNKLLGNGKDLAEVVAQKTKGRPSISKSLDSKTKQETKQILKTDIQKVLDKVKTKIDNREDLEANLLNNIFHQVETGDIEDVRDNVNKLLRDANLSQEQAKDITNKLLGNGKDLAEVVAQKTKAGSSKSRPIDSKLKQETKQSLRADTQKALDEVKTKIDNREDLEANLVNTILNQVEMGDVEDARHDVNKFLRNANIPQEQVKDITNKLLGKGKDLAEVVAQRMKSRSRSDEDSLDNSLKSFKAYGQKHRPDNLGADIYSKKVQMSSKQKDELKYAIIEDINYLIEGAPQPLSSHTKNILKAKFSNALLKGLSSPYNKDEIKSNVLDILSEESIKLQSDKIPKQIDRPQATTSSAKFGQKGARRRNSPGRTKIRNERILQEISIALDGAPTNIPKSKKNSLKKKLADIILTNIKSDINDVRMKIYNLLSRETHLHKDIVSDWSNDVIERIIDVIKESEITNRRKTKKIIYSLQIEGTKRAKLRGGTNNFVSRTGKRKKEGNKSSDEDGPINRAKPTAKQDYSKRQSISENIEEDSPQSVSSNEMQNMKGYLKGEILDLLEKYNVKFSAEPSLKSGSTSPSLEYEPPYSSTPRDDVRSAPTMNELLPSTVYDDDDDDSSIPLNTIRSLDRISSGEYLNKITYIVGNWADELPVDFVGRSRETMVKELAGDIIERQKYLQLNPDATTSSKEELECLKYQVFRCLNNIVDVGDLTYLTPMIEDLSNRINGIDLPLFNKYSKRHLGIRNSTDSNGKQRTSGAFIDKFRDWVDSLPVKFKNEQEKEQYEILKSELFKRLCELGPNASPQAIRDEIYNFLRKAPLDPSKEIDLDGKIYELMRIVQTTDPSKMTSFESKTAQKKLPNLLYDFIENWCDSLPFDDRLNQDTIKSMKPNLANKILQTICQLNLNPEILNDDFLYEDILRDEIDSLLSDIRHYIPIGDEQLAEYKDVLVNKIKEAKQKAQIELAGQMYKQQLKDAISRTLPLGLDLTNDDQTSLEMLKDAVADAYINLNYASDNEELRNKMKKKIADEVTRFCNNYLQRHPEAALCSNKINQDLYAALKNVSLPCDESMRSEVEHVRMKEVITDWVRGLPLAEPTLTGQSTLNKMISILAKRLHDLEKAGETHDSDYIEEMKKEIKKWLCKLPLLGGKDAIDHYAADLIERLKNTEDSRKFDASVRLQLDDTEICPGPCHYSLKEKPKPKPCPDTCSFNSQYPSVLTREDREHLDKIRERVQQARSKLAKRPCRDASPSTCIDTSSQTEIRPHGSMKSIPSVCPGNFQRSSKSASSRVRESPSCRIPCETPRSQKSPYPGMYTPPPQAQQGRRRMVSSPYVDSFSPCGGSYSEVQPQIIVKEYFWDSTGNSNHQIPCRTPCDTFQGSQEPRSPCSQPSPPCRGHYSQPHTVPQSPQISSSDQENRRPRPEPSTSRYYKEKVTRLGSLDDMRGPNMRQKQSETFEWGSVRFPEDDDFWGPVPRPMIASDEDYEPVSRERERKEERVRCRCRERVLTKCSGKRKNKQGGSCQSCNNDPSRRCPKCGPVHCPHPSYLYFRK